MNKLINYFNDLADPDRKRFCTDTDITEGYLRSAISRGIRFNATRCVQIEKATNGFVTRKDLRPKDWHLIWPELRNQ